MATAAQAQDTRLLIVSPVRNEAPYIERVARAVSAQTRPPDLWLVADDNSDDGTGQILARLEREIPFLKVVSIPRPPSDVADRLAYALEARAYNIALETVDWRDFTHVAKLDGDVELPEDYLETVLDAFRVNDRLGITGGSIIEPSGPGGRWASVSAPSYHVHGALKMYSLACFTAVGGIQERLGWDTIDETYARMRGFETFRDPALVARHHRPSASADGNLRGRARHGECAYIVRYGPGWVLLRSLKMGIRWNPRGLSGLAFLWGYATAFARRMPRVEDDEFRRFVRAELRGRMLRALRLGLARRPQRG